eukprot:g1084.t1
MQENLIDSKMTANDAVNTHVKPKTKEIGLDGSGPFVFLIKEGKDAHAWADAGRFTPGSASASKFRDRKQASYAEKKNAMLLRRAAHAGERVRDMRKDVGKVKRNIIKNRLKVKHAQAGTLDLTCNVAGYKNRAKGKPETRAILLVKKKERLYETMKQEKEWKAQLEEVVRERAASQQRFRAEFQANKGEAGREKILVRREAEAREAKEQEMQDRVDSLWRETKYARGWIDPNARAREKTPSSSSSSGKERAQSASAGGRTTAPPGGLFSSTFKG